MKGNALDFNDHSLTNSIKLRQCTQNKTNRERVNYTERMRARTLLSAEEFDNYPFEEDKRYELDDGELIVETKAAYEHNRVLQELTVTLAVFFETNPIGEVLISENVYAISPTTRRSPDVSVILGNRKEELWDATVIHIAPDVAAEVLSPDDTLVRIHHKITQYFKAGVKEVWLIYPEDRTVEIWTGPNLPAPALTGQDSLASGLLPGFTMPLPDLFS